MLLWDIEMKSSKEDISLLEPRRRLRIAADALEWTLGTFDSRISELAASAVRSSISRLREEESRGNISPAAPERLEDQVEAYVSECDDPGVEQLLMAAVNCFELPAAGMGGEYLYTILSDCYESLLDREEIDIVIPEVERKHPRLVEAIQVQKEMIRRA
ncbi:hypothetical protein DZF91_33390 [Actinomadura logoneensis]|uniref:Uncharacterized protein n=1 Tax=Actinomadura logoneensis TaxID=2293572 RepID=A0A372JBF6_9ACTN|nr:hypothetical protein [Actinomadura logoneensis]RFU37341.1 hypothetical protein DZF91_33390 [Actinomadura logoneensis]